jgi:PAS domain S-box-containing protein
MTRADFFSLWEHMPEPVLVTDAEQVIRHVNPLLEALVRRARSELVGEKVDLLLPTASRSRHAAIAHQFIKSGEQQRKLAHSRMVRVRRGDGIEVPIEVTISSADVEGQRYFALMLRDLSEQLALQDEVAALTQRLARIERMEALSTLSAGLAHQFSEVLARVRASASRVATALEGGEVSVAGREVHTLMAHVDRAAHETAELQLFARRDTSVALVDPQGPLDRAAAAARLLAGAGIEVIVTFDPDLPRVAVVERELEQAVVNLLNNALHAMRERPGKLSLLAHQLELEAPMPCTTLTLTPGTWLAISVEDEGSGIEPSVLPRIFDPFFTTKPRTEGTGLGLAMVYGCARSANGGINVESRVDHGTRVTLFLPVVKQTSEVPAEPVSTRKRKVLLVDADTFVAASLKRSLELLGHGCHVVGHAGDALSIIRLDPAAFDLVVAELNLPGMRGDELASRISLLRASLPVCVVVGNERLPTPDGYRVVRRPATATELDVVLRMVGSSNSPVPTRVAK